jgi:hypothetical protein
MNTPQHPTVIHVRMMWAAVALAVFTALAYVLIAFNILGVGDL